MNEPLSTEEEAKLFIKTHRADKFDRIDQRLGEILTEIPLFDLPPAVEDRKDEMVGLIREARESARSCARMLRRTTDS